MRSRLALLLVAAVIFAPGWHGEASAQHRRGSDLAARVLAPTIDEGAIRGTAADANYQLGHRQSKRWRPGLTLEVVTAFGLSALMLSVLWLVAFYTAPPLNVYRLHFRFGRAPPRLQPA